MRYSFFLVWAFVGSMLALGVSGCGASKYNSDYNLNQAQLKKGSKAGALASVEGDTSKPSVENNLPKEEEEQQKKKKKKPSKRYFMGEKVSRGFVKSGPKGDKQVIETFSYLPAYQEPVAYVQQKYYYDSKERKIRVTSADADPAKHKILHGPYKKRRGDKIIEQGYFYLGTKHLRWERYRNDELGTLFDKAHFEKGFPRDAVVTYYSGDTKKIKEVIPYAYGEVQGTYYRFYENGQVEWSGQYEKGRKVGVWVKHYDFRNRRHYEYQYPKTAYDAPFEPILMKEFDRHGSIVYERGKIDKRSAQR